MMLLQWCEETVWVRVIHRTAIRRIEPEGLQDWSTAAPAIDGKPTTDQC